jgi:hypothetical protein
MKKVVYNAFAICLLVTPLFLMVRVFNISSSLAGYLSLLISAFGWAAFVVGIFASVGLGAAIVGAVIQLIRRQGRKAAIAW